MPKKIFLSSFITIICFTFSLPVHAASPTEVTQNYILNDTYCEVQEVFSAYIQSFSTQKSMYVEVAVTYYDTMSPPSSLFYQTTKNDIFYSGNLKLSHYEQGGNKISALYVGTIYAQ